MYSLNVPVPGRVAGLATDLARELPEAYARPRGEHTLGVKRLVNDSDPTVDGDLSYDHIEAHTRELLAGQSPFEVQITTIEQFEEAPTGSSPVVYLAVESDELYRLHDQLTDTFPPVEGIEDNGYTPHVTVARGGSRTAATRLVERDIDPISWTVNELVFWHGRHNQPISTLSLPAP